MNKRIKLIPINLIKPHEKTSAARLKFVLADIKTRKIIINPVVADRATYTLLDGHHRLAALKKIKTKKIPVYLVDYQKIKVILRRKKFISPQIKHEIIARSFFGKLFPVKTTKHLVKNRPHHINIKLCDLA